jgi:pSer/pThr/pTyr-binding forkhead associated (FHA) protein
MSADDSVQHNCAACGVPLPADATACTNCGAPTTEGTGALNLTSAVTPTVIESSGPLQNLGSEPAYDLPVGSMALVVLRGSDEGRRIVLEAPTIVGRAPDTGLFLDDVTVSRHHVELTRGGDGSWSLHDLGSLNGTYVNRQRVDLVVLNGGDEVQVGKYRFLVQLSGLRA